MVQGQGFDVGSCVLEVGRGIDLATVVSVGVSVSRTKEFLGGWLYSPASYWWSREAGVAWVLQPAALTQAGGIVFASLPKPSCSRGRGL